ncbi:RNA 3'-terminal phosphate cyclase [Sphingomonas endolithica]|uniref:RNA 3'-terminal phosphate cyclase n=1 Tax=Sphingomonas endolithica TaxID=2972485 RepID=UPI0021AF6F49|nr:RNA 3'-terminal phosphate cyclase [Sphingomonas sp. ZFBP2030]
MLRSGTYPRGGGQFEVNIAPAPLRLIDCLQRGAPVARLALAMFEAIPPGVATAGKLLAGWPEEAFSVRELPEAAARTTKIEKRGAKQ